MGSRKYGSFLFISTVLATSLEVAASRFLKILPASGPFGAIYAAFILFYGAHVLLACPLTQLIDCVAFSSCGRSACTQLKMSPACIHTATVPKLHPRLLGFFGVDFSDKSLYYAVGAQARVCFGYVTLGGMGTNARGRHLLLGPLAL